MLYTLFIYQKKDNVVEKLFEFLLKVLFTQFELNYNLKHAKKRNVIILYLTG